MKQKLINHFKKKIDNLLNKKVKTINRFHNKLDITSNK